LTEKQPGARVLNAPFSPSADRRSALDRAHRGDIEGALGSVGAADTGPRLSFGRRLGTLLAIMGPGLIVMAADSDAGTLSVYAQAGQDYGLKLLWPLLLLAPVLFVNQEMVARLGAVTGAGHARLIYERFGRRWGAFALGDLLMLNLLTIVTEFIGVNLALSYFGVSRYLSVPIAGAVLVLVTGTGSYRRWERMMYGLLAANLLVVPLVLLSHPASGPLARSLVPGVPGSIRTSDLLFVIALVGTTVSPWQLFFQQSNVVDKRITARWLNYERTDTFIGTFLFVAGGAAVIVTCASAFDGTAFHGAFINAGTAATLLAHRLGPAAGMLFALVLFNASLLGAGVVTLTTSYAVGDVFGTRHSLHRSWRDARVFHASFAAVISLSVAIALIPGAPLGMVTTAVQAMAGVLLPSATIFLLLLSNDEAVLGPWTNPRWLNALATLIVGVLLVLSGLLIAATLLPGVDVGALALWLAAVLGVVLAGLAVFTLGRRRPPKQRYGTPWEQATWTMPPLESLSVPLLTPWRKLGLAVLRVYLSIALILLVVETLRRAMHG
jgi:NRAMP (natural resistance-associated macrophage protein)-like metal ion transporter